MFDGDTRLVALSFNAADSIQDSQYGVPMKIEVTGIVSEERRKEEPEKKSET